MCMWPENTHRLRQYRVVPASITFHDPVSLWRTPGIRRVLIDRRDLAQDWVYDLPGSLNLPKDGQWGSLEFNEDLGGCFGQAFASSKIERDVCPAPGVEVEFHRSKCLYPRPGCYTILLEIA